MNMHTAGNEPKGGILFRAARAFMTRTGLASSLGVSFDGKRDLYASFGWPKEIAPIDHFEMYNRGGIAKRIAEAYPDSTWGRPPQLYSSENEEWGDAFSKIAWNLDLWTYLRAADILSRLGRYSILLIGTNRGALEHAIPRGGAGELRITYLQPYTELEATVHEWETDPMNERFGFPKSYSIQPKAIFEDQNTGSISNRPKPTSAFIVHHSRVLHLTSGGLQNRVMGSPVYSPIWNYLEDLMKVVGASSESYWRNAYQGLHADVGEDLELDPEDEAALSAELDEYEHNMRRIVRTRGVVLKALGSKVADPKGAFDVLVTLIAGTVSMPKRVLLGSEAGQLASSQDKANWAERVEEYRELHAEPNVLWPFVMWLMENKLIPTPNDVTTIRALWPDAYRMSPLERGQTAAQTARSIANIAKGMAPIVTKKGTPEVRDGEGNIITPGTEDETGEALITLPEARRIIGLSTDSQVLIKRPEDNA